MHDSGKGSVFDYVVNGKTGKFQTWAELVVDAPYDGIAPMGSVFVPTAETSSLRYFLDMMIELHKPIMFVGGAGVGKTQLVKGKLATLPDGMMSLSISLNYFTDVASFQKVRSWRCAVNPPDAAKPAPTAAHSYTGIYTPVLQLSCVYRCWNRLLKRRRGLTTARLAPSS
jgi:hypothetical protein